MSSESIVVMKFGGTSVADTKGRSALARRVEATLEVGYAPVIVVSAMGRSGAPYATDTLLGLLAGLPGDSRESDLLASTGEIISAVVVAHELRAAGIAAVAVSGTEAGIVTDSIHGSANITEIHTAALHGLIAEGYVPVVAGFQGVAEDGSVTTLGRGGSDTTACALGVALGARSVEIYTDVDGVMTADPRTCAHATVLEVIGAEELFQMARHGSRVVHTPAAELALGSGLAVHVKNTFSAHPGTLVTDLRTYTSNGVATAISHASNVTRFVVALGCEEGSLEHTVSQKSVYNILADAGVSLDMFTPCGSSLVFTVNDSQITLVKTALASLGRSCTIRSDLAKVTLVGAGMHGIPGVMARVAQCLADACVHVLQTADSHTTISVLIPAEDLRVAVEALHVEFQLGSAPIAS